MRLTERVHLELEKLLRPGDIALDATAGNGHDSLAMAQLVGTEGQVFAIDLQTAAIVATRHRLERQGDGARFTLFEGDHRELLRSLAAERPGSFRAITFNLGYLPGGDKTITTQAEQTLPALDAAAVLLGPNGALFVTAYRGHPGGAKEAAAVADWMVGRNRTKWQVEQHKAEAANEENRPPVLWIARKGGHYLAE